MQETDRRQNRSDVASEATKLFCEAMAKKLNARTLVLANEDGLTVSGVGDADAIEELAALAVSAPSRIRKLAVEEEPIYRLPMSIDGVWLVLASIGGEAPQLEEASAAVERILFHAA